VGTRTSGSEGGGEQTTARKLGMAARLRPHHLGIARSPAYHYEPETNGCVERFMGILKEQVLWIERFETHEALRSRARVRPRLQPVVAARAPRLPHTDRSLPAPALSGARGMIATITTEVSGEPGPGQPVTTI